MLREISYRAVQLAIPVVQPFLRDSVINVLPPKNQEGMDICLMHSLCQTVEAAVSVYLPSSFMERAVTVLEQLNRCMVLRADESKIVQQWEQLTIASHSAQQLADRGYLGYAQALSNAVYDKYLVQQGITEALILPDLLRAYGHRVEKPLAILARETGLVDDADPNSLAMREFIFWIEEVRDTLALPHYIDVLKRQDFAEIAEDADDEASPFYPVPEIYSAYELKSFISLMQERKHEQ